MSDSHIIFNKGTTVYAGCDAIHVVKALALSSAIQLYVRAGIIPTRGIGITKMLKAATAYTKIAYKRKQAAQAVIDLRRWADEMVAAIPQELVS